MGSTDSLGARQVASETPAAVELLVRSGSPAGASYSVLRSAAWTPLVTYELRSSPVSMSG